MNITGEKDRVQSRRYQIRLLFRPRLPEPGRMEDVFYKLTSDERNWDALRQAFEQRGSIRLAEFVDIALPLLHQASLAEHDEQESFGNNAADDSSLIESLCSVFTEADVDATGFVTWSKLTALLLDDARRQGMSSDLPPQPPAMQEDWRLSRAVHTLNADALLSTTLPASSSPVFIVFSTGSKQVCVMSRSGARRNTIDLPSRALACCACPPVSELHDSILVVACANSLLLSMPLWSKESVFQRARCSSCIVSLCYDAHRKQVVAGDEHGAVSFIDPMQLQALDGQMRICCHTDMVSHITQVESFQAVASASLDGTIEVHRAAGMRRKSLEAHSKAVTALAYSSDCNLLLSGSIDKHILIYNPLVNKPLAKLHEHAKTPVGLIALHGTSLAVSVDTGGTVNIIDLKSLAVVQSFAVQLLEDDDEVKCIEADQRDLTLFVIGKKLHSFSCIAIGRSFATGTNKALALPHSLPERALNLRYSDAHCAIVLASTNSVRVFCAKTAAPLREAPRQEEEITCMELDAMHRRIVVGTASGMIKMYSLATCSLLWSSSERDTSEVESLAHVRKLKVVLSCSCGPIKTHDEHGGGSTGLLSYGLNEQCTAICESFELGMIAAGTAAGYLLFWSEFRFKRLGYFKILPNDIATLTIMPSVGALIACDTDGNFALCSIKPDEQQCFLLSTFTIEKAGTSATCISSYFDRQAEALFLLAGDEHGAVHVWNVSASQTEDGGLVQAPVKKTSFTAHKQRVTSIEVISQADRLLTASSDRLVKMFALNEGWRSCGWIGGPEWDFPGDIQPSMQQKGSRASETRVEAVSPVQSEPLRAFSATPTSTPNESQDVSSTLV